MILTNDKTFKEFCDRCGSTCNERTIEKCKRQVVLKEETKDQTKLYEVISDDNNDD